MGTRLSSHPLPLSPSAVTLNNTLSLISATITLRNKLVFSRRGMEMGMRWPPYASGGPFSFQHFNLFGDRQTADQFSLQFSRFYNSFSLSIFLCVCPCAWFTCPFPLNLWIPQNMWVIYEEQCSAMQIWCKWNIIFTKVLIFMFARKTLCGERGCCGCVFACVCPLWLHLELKKAEEGLWLEDRVDALCAKSPQSPLCSFSVWMTPLHEKLGSSSMHASMYTHAHTRVQYEWAQPLCRKRIICCDKETKAVTMFNMKRPFHYHVL